MAGFVSFFGSGPTGWGQPLDGLDPETGYGAGVPGAISHPSGPSPQLDPYPMHRPIDPNAPPTPEITYPPGWLEDNFWIDIPVLPAGGVWMNKETNKPSTEADIRVDPTAPVVNNTPPTTQPPATTQPTNSYPSWPGMPGGYEGGVGQIYWPQWPGQTQTTPPVTTTPPATTQPPATTNPDPDSTWQNGEVNPTPGILIPEWPDPNKTDDPKDKDNNTGINIPGLPNGTNPGDGTIVENPGQGEKKPAEEEKSVSSIFWDVAGELLKTGANYFIADYFGKKATDEIAKQTDQSNALLERMYNQGRDDLQPWREVGGAAVNAYARAMGLPQSSAAPLSTNGAGRYGGFMKSPGYNFELAEGQKTVDQLYASGPTGYLSGARNKAALGYSQGLASQGFNKYLTNLGAPAGYGQSAADSTAGSANQYAANAANLNSNLGDARASGYVNSGNAAMYGINNGITSLLNKWNV